MCFPRLNNIVYNEIIVGKLKKFIDHHAEIDVNESIVRKSDPAQVVVFGIGLGCLLHRLVFETQVKLVVLLEESIEMLHHSMYVIDYEEIFSEIEARKGKVVLFLQELVDHHQEVLFECLRYNSFSFVQAGRVIINDFNVGSVDFHQGFLNITVLLTSTKGFFLDELIMIRNYSNNVYRYKVPIFYTDEVKKPTLPCFIIGNGPSLENVFEILRKYRDQVVLISCGTAIGSLLARGIRPDIHTELENVPEIPKILEIISKEHGLKGIHLVHTSTLNADAPKLFERSTQFHRSGMSQFLHPTHYQGQLVHAEPTVTNVGLSLAGHLGFSEVYFFGVDMGTIDETRFHASNNIYDNEEALEKFGWSKNVGSPGLLPMSFRATFGGQGQTSDVMLFSRSRLESAITYFRRCYLCNYYNCSDGIQINGTTPKLAHTVDITSDPRAKIDFMARFHKMGQEVDSLGEPASHFDLILNPDRIHESFRHYHDMIEEHRTPVDKDTVHPLYEMFTAFEEEFERSQNSTDEETRSRGFHGAFISGSWCYWTHKYVVFDANMPGHLRSSASEVFIEALHGALDLAEEKILALSVEFDDVRLARLADEAAKEHALS